jgi:hypothetical protein
MSIGPSSPLVLLGMKGGHEIFIDGGNRIAVHLNEGDKKSHFISSQNALERGQWHHVAITKDGVNLKIFIDGQLDSTQQVPPEYGQFGPGEYFVGLVQGGDPSAVSFIDDYTISRAVTYETSFNPKPPNIAGESTWLLYDFLEGGGAVARNTVKANADGQIASGAWVKSHLPESYYSKIQNFLQDKARTWVELQRHDKWQSTGIFMRKGQILRIVKIIYFKQIELDAGVAERAPLVSQAILNARIGDGAETPIDEVRQEYEAPETGLLKLQNSGAPKNILVHVVLE